MEDTFEVVLTREGAYRFRVDFGDGHGATLEMDEPEPLGEGSGPNASRVLAAAVGNCLSASLLFCLSKARIEVAEMRTEVTGSVVRNEQGRLRVGPLKVRVQPGLQDAPPTRIERCLDIFEDFCIVTGSVRAGLDVHVNVDVSTVEGEPLAEAAS